MPKFTLIAEHIDEDTCQTYSKVTHEFYHETLDEVVMSLQEFLRGVGYYFVGDACSFGTAELCKSIGRQEAEYR